MFSLLKKTFIKSIIIFIFKKKHFDTFFITDANTMYREDVI